MSVGPLGAKPAWINTKTLRTLGGRPAILIDVFRLVESEITTIDVPDALYPAFKDMIQRAVNLWPDAPPEIKHFADVITNGKPMQDYFVQLDFKKPLQD